VVWRQGGTRDGSWESETFLHRTEATRFRRDVDAAGQHWPDSSVKGVGYVTAHLEPVTEIPFLPYARAYVRDLTGITPATRHRYDRQVLALDQQLRPIVGGDVNGCARSTSTWATGWIGSNRGPACPTWSSRPTAPPW
jgi:hypothetical protein